MKKIIKTDVVGKVIFIQKTICWAAITSQELCTS